MNTDALKSEIAAVLAEYPDAEVGVSIRDRSREVTIDVSGDLVFHAASTMKIAVMIELYRQSAEGYFGLDDSLQITNEFSSIVDGSTFSIEEDSDTEIYSMLGQRVPIRSLVYRLITSSSNLATNILINLVTADSVQATIERMGIRHMEVLRGVEDLKAFDAGMNNTTTAADLALLLEALRDGEVVSSAASAEMLEIMSDVPLEMIMANRGESGRVAHKTGMITAHHHDAGIVFPDNEQPYILVILTRGIAEDQESTRMGREISEVVYRHLRG
ncbi:MAG: serine hydrolase [Rhodothermales bacterium]|nr:serine hydrolase [Rhodothermales bacterium]